MSAVHRYLITTADEQTWKFDRPIIFLGEWCQRYDRMHVWKNMDAIVATPYGLDAAKKEYDYTYARNLEATIFPHLCAVLNEHHATAHSIRYWQIVLGHWFRRYVDVMVNRVNSLQKCFNDYKISSTALYANRDYVLASQDSNSAIWAFSDARWNAKLAMKIMQLLDFKNCEFDLIEDNQKKEFPFTLSKMYTQVNSNLLTRGRHKVQKFINQLVKDSDAFIINTYLPKMQVIKLQLALGQWPHRWVSPKISNSYPINTVIRNKLSQFMLAGDYDDLEQVIRVLSFELLPMCYLEGYEDINSLIQQQPWPKNPKFIFTSNSFDTDEVFKIWTANKTESGTKYFVGQHGNNYGTYRYLKDSIEEISSDKFITWGWSENLPQHTPAFIFKTSAKKSKKYNPKGGLLLIELCLNHRITTWDSDEEFSKYFEDQKIFIENLSDQPRKKLTIRLHSEYVHHKWGEEARWKEFDPMLKLDKGSAPVFDLVSKSRLVVHSYDSTGILETLSLNIPTVAFWQNDLHHLRESAKPYYQLLIDAGIVHLSPDSVARKINEIWGDVDGWWQQENVQTARNQFCEQYAKNSQHPISMLRLIFRGSLGGRN